MAPVTPKAKRFAKPTTPQSAPVSPTTGLVTRSRAKFILQQGENPFAPELVLSRHAPQRRTSRDNAPVTPPSSPSLTPHNAARADVQRQPFPQQQNARPLFPPKLEDPFAPVEYTRERTPLILTQEDVDRINRLPQLRFGDARAPSAAPSDFYRAPTPGNPEGFYRAPTPAYPEGWNTKELANNYDSSQVLRDQLQAMTPEERASHYEARQFICLSRGTTPASSMWWCAPTPRGSPLPPLPSPIVEAEESVRPPTPEPEPLRRARVPSTLGPVRGDRRTSLRSYASHSALSVAARVPTTSPSRTRRTSAKYTPNK